MALQPESDNFSEVPESKQELERELQVTQSNAYAKGTWKNLCCQWRSFLRFCKKYKIKQWPVSEHVMCLYAQYLAHSFHAIKSVRNYLNGVRTLHILAQVTPPNLKDIEMRLTLRGLSRKMARPVKRAQPLTPEILLDILTFLDLNKKADLIFWGILLVGFFGMLRKSNLIPDSIDSFDPVKQMTKSHIEFRKELAVIHVTWAKNLQFRERLLEIPIFKMEESPLCPVRILRTLMKLPGGPQSPLFGGRKVAFTYNKFQRKFRQVLKKAGYVPSAFSSHSLRRGSVCFAYRSGAPLSLVAVYGDWASDAFKNYLQFPIELRAVVALKMREGILKRGF